jgi:hypothetical protein
MGLVCAEAPQRAPAENSVSIICFIYSNIENLNYELVFSPAVLDYFVMRLLVNKNKKRAKGLLFRTCIVMYVA